MHNTLYKSTIHGVWFIFRTAEYMFATAEYMFTTAEYTFRTAEHNSNNYSCVSISLILPDCSRGLYHY